MTDDALYDLVHDAVRAAIAAENGGGDVPIHRRFAEGSVVFRDADGKVVKEVPASALFRKVTAIRDKLRVLEQKLNAHERLDDVDKADLQAQLTRAYGSLTTFNFLFRDEADKFIGTGG